MKNTILLIIFVISINMIAQESDSLVKTNRIDILEDQVKEIRRDQLNYKIEKDILKDTYSSNYESINQIITIVLGIIGLLGFLGIRDINSIKKEYSSELGKLNNLKAELEGRIKAISDTQKTYEQEITKIQTQNEEQNNKIKLLELQNKIDILITEKKYPAALEVCNKALEISHNDSNILTSKALIYTVTRSYNDAASIYKKILKDEPDNEDAIMNLAEVYLFLDKPTLSQKLMNENSELFEDDNGIEFKTLYKFMLLFNKDDLDGLKEEIDNKLDKKEFFTAWDLGEAKTYVKHSDSINCKEIMSLFLEYLDEEIDAEILKEKLE